MTRRMAVLTLAVVLLALTACRTAPRPVGAAFLTKLSVGDHALAVSCRGSGSPTVVLDAGLGATHATWTGVLGHLADQHTCVYDRWGRGASDPLPAGQRQSVGHAVEDLRALLRAAQVPPPYVLVGHSIAGLIERTYTMTHPDEIAGLVMVDAVPDDWDTWWHTKTFTAGGESLTYVEESELLKHDTLGDRPTVVVQAERTAFLDPSAAFGEYWHRSQRTLSTLSTNALLVTALGSDHLVPDVRPELVARAITLVGTAVRARARLPACVDAGLTALHGGC